MINSNVFYTVNFFKIFLTTSIWLFSGFIAHILLKQCALGIFKRLHLLKSNTQSIQKCEKSRVKSLELKISSETSQVPNLELKI